MRAVREGWEQAFCSKKYNPTQRAGSLFNSSILEVFYASNCFEQVKDDLLAVLIKTKDRYLSQRSKEIERLLHNIGLDEQIFVVKTVHKEESTSQLKSLGSDQRIRKKILISAKINHSGSLADVMKIRKSKECDQGVPERQPLRQAFRRAIHKNNESLFQVAHGNSIFLVCFAHSRILSSKKGIMTFCQHEQTRCVVHLLPAAWTILQMLFQWWK